MIVTFELYSNEYTYEIHDGTGESIKKRLQTSSDDFMTTVMVVGELLSCYPVSVTG